MSVFVRLSSVVLILFFLLPIGSSITLVHANNPASDLENITFVTDVIRDNFILKNEDGEPGYDVADVINKAIGAAVTLVGIALVILIAWYGTGLIYQQFTGDIFKANSAKQHLTNALWGVVILLCSFIILKFFTPNLLNLRGGFLDPDAEFDIDSEGGSGLLYTLSTMEMYPCDNNLLGNLVRSLNVSIEPDTIISGYPVLSNIMLNITPEERHLNGGYEFKKPIAGKSDCEPLTGDDTAVFALRVIHAEKDGKIGYDDFELNTSEGVQSFFIDEAQLISQIQIIPMVILEKKTGGKKRLYRNQGEGIRTRFLNNSPFFVFNENEELPCPSVYWEANPNFTLSSDTGTGYKVEDPTELISVLKAIDVERCPITLDLEERESDSSVKSRATVPGPGIPDV